jgi:predicted phage tail protein
LHGHFAKLYPHGPVEIVADTAAEAIEAFSRQVKIFKPNFTDNTRPAARVLGFNTVESLLEKSDVVDLHIVPSFSGGKSPFLQILIGGLLIAVAFVIPGAGIALLGGTLTITSSTVFLMGAGLVLGGLLQMLFPVKQPELQESYYLGVPGNTVKIGTPIPLIFGTVMAYGHFLSFNTDAINIA